MGMIDCSSLRRLYLSEIERERAARPALKGGTLTGEDVASLPEPVRKYFRHCGFLGRDRMTGAFIHWDEARYKRSRQAGWMDLECRQFNSVARPARIVYMRSRLVGVLPFEGRDKYQDGRGNMRMKLAGCLKVVDACGVEMDVSALVTVLAEALLIPTCALCEYVTWTPLNDVSARAVIKYAGRAAGGIFRFTPEGEIAGFETEDRYYSKKGTEYERKRWVASTGEYREAGGIRFPTRMRAAWHIGEGEFTYFEGRIGSIEYETG